MPNIEAAVAELARSEEELVTAAATEISAKTAVTSTVGPPTNPESTVNFIEPTTTRHWLSNGSWVDLKDYLTIYDQRRAEKAGTIHVIVMDTDDAGKPTKSVVDRIDWSIYDIERANIWIARWLMVDKAGDPRELSLDAIKALNPVIFQEISDLVFSRVIAIAAERIEEKKRRIQVRKTQAVSPADQTSSS